MVDYKAIWGSTMIPIPSHCGIVEEQEQQSDLRPYANNSICCQKEKILRGWVDIFHLFAPPWQPRRNNRSIAKSHERAGKKSYHETTD